MATMRTKELKKKYEFACNEYLQKFCKKQEITNEGWVNEVIGGIAVCSDFFFNFQDVVFDVNSKQPKGQIIDWYYEVLEDPGKAINYTSYTKRLRTAKYLKQKKNDKRNRITHRQLVKNA